MALAPNRHAPGHVAAHSGRQHQRVSVVGSILCGFLLLFACLAVSTGRALSQGPHLESGTLANCSQPTDGAGKCELFGEAWVSFPTIDVRVEVAETGVDHARGLGGHAPLGTTDGMMFVFETPDFHSFWMKGMTFNLDIIWIAGATDSLRVVHIASDVPAFATETPDGRLPTYSPSRPSRYVLEVNAGFAADHRISVGTPVSFIRDPNTHP